VSEINSSHTCTEYFAPRLISFFNAELCKCGGGSPTDDRPYGRFVHIYESAKLGTAAHGKHKTNLLGAIIKYGNLDHRLENMTHRDLQAARKYFDLSIMETFGYHHPDTL
jgi:hypothetical protein